MVKFVTQSTVCTCTQYLPAQENNHGISFGWNKPKQEDVAAGTVVALNDGFSQGPIFVKGHLLVFCSDQMVDDMANGKGTKKTSLQIHVTALPN